MIICKWPVPLGDFTMLYGLPSTEITQNHQKLAESRFIQISEFVWHLNPQVQRARNNEVG